MFNDVQSIPMVLNVYHFGCIFPKSRGSSPTMLGMLGTGEPGIVFDPLRVVPKVAQV